MLQSLDIPLVYYQGPTCIKEEWWCNILYDIKLHVCLKLRSFSLAGSFSQFSKCSTDMHISDQCSLLWKLCFSRFEVSNYFFVHFSKFRALVILFLQDYKVVVFALP